MKCHYEVLEVKQNADDAEIKSAYRKLALKWHPDKNLDNADYAKEQFQIVQQAYEVLSDKQERAWYDRHREQILHGSDSNFEDNSLDVFQFFTTSCFKGYNDDEQGFYAVYSRVFDKIAKEDMEFMDKEEFCSIPTFGTSTSDYNEIVAPFYNYWMAYSTRKSFAWLDPYNVQETRDRRVAKLIEKENKKVRQKARKERNEEVRNLVSFVRKRDKRVKSYVKLMKEKTLENREKQKNIRKQKLLESHQTNISDSQAEWTKFDNVKSELEEIEKHLAEQFGEELSNSELEDEEMENDDNLYCVACNKVFKTVKAFENHESSKKHREKVELLKVTMNEEESEDEIDNISPSLSELEEVEVAKPKVKKKNKKSKAVLQTELSEDEKGIDFSLKQDTDDDFDFKSSLKSKKKSKKASVNTVDVKEDKINIEEVVEKSRKPKKDKKAKKDISEIDTNLICVTCSANFPSKNKLFDHLKKTNHGVALNTKTKRKNVN